MLSLSPAGPGDPDVKKATPPIDLRELRYMDSSGLRELFSANQRARGEGRRVVLVKGPGPIERVLEVVRAEAAIVTVDDPASIVPSNGR